MSDLRNHAEDIHEQFSDHLNVDVDDIESRLSNLVDEYKVPVDEARRSVTNHYLDEAGLERDALGGGDGSELVELAEVDEAEQWVTIEAQVVDLWEPRSDSVGQVGLLGDESGTIKFTKWAKSDLEELDAASPTGSGTSSPTSTRASTR